MTVTMPPNHHHHHHHHHHCMVSAVTVAFLLRGRVQNVKMRRYVESAAKHFGVGGYVINTDDGDVFGEAWIVNVVGGDGGDDGDNTKQYLLRDFSKWIRGEWEPASFTNRKPTPIGTAYPETAQVETCVFLGEGTRWIWKDRQTSDFEMIREEQQAAMMARERKDILERLLQAANSKKKVNNDTEVIGDGEITIGAWPKR